MATRVHPTPLELMLVLDARTCAMKKRYLSKAIPHGRSAVFFAGFLWAATIACAGPEQTQRSTGPDATTPPQTEVQVAQNTPKNKPTNSGAWHHFGESDEPSVVRQNQPGVWHAFGPDQGTPEVDPDETAPRQDFGGNRLANLERQMWALVNQDRLDPETAAETGGRAQPLRWNENLAEVARAHSHNMLEQRFFDHVDPDGRTLATRINEAGIPWRASGENIAIYGTIMGAEAAFMNEPRFQHNHRANILNANYTDVGIGIVQGSNGSLYITQDFVKLPADGGRVSNAPRPTYRPAPSLTPAARKAKIEGVVALSIVIDTQGRVTAVKQTSRPLGAGLDQRAAATVRAWKFEPARRDGVPVAAKMLVKVTFKRVANGHLYTTPDFVKLPAISGGVSSAPRPIYRPVPGYTSAAREAGIEGAVALSIAIDDRGNVTEVRQTSPPLGAGLDEIAATTVRTWKYEPARRDGVPVAVKMLVEITFKRPAAA